jgi:hypothetical protein
MAIFELCVRYVYVATFFYSCGGESKQFLKAGERIKNKQNFCVQK